MYEYLLDNLISYTQLESNLRRAASEGLISKLNKRQMTELALKYFGVDENDNYTEDKEKIVAYRCPYSGKIIKNVGDIHLDHIIPLNNNGGTILFNCVPVYNSVNISKKAYSLLGWWTRQEFFSLERLERLVNYILEAYLISFDDYTIEELEESHSYFLNDDIERIGDLTQDKRAQEKRYNKSISFFDISYQQLITNMIMYLKDNGIQCTRYETLLKELEHKNIFNDVEYYELVERELQSIFKNIFGDGNSYITYSLNININKLIKSFKNNDFRNELAERISHINSILEENNLSLTDYMKNLIDIEDINLLYFDISKINDDQKKEFINGIKIGHDTKILMFINMLKVAKTNDDISLLLLSRPTHESFKSYKQDENGNFVVDKEFGIIGTFWNNNKDLILSIIYQDDRYIELREKLDNYYMMTRGGQKSVEGQNRKIEIFINMLAMANSKDEIIEILKKGSTYKFKTYKQDENGNFVVDKEFGNVSYFWEHNKDKIMAIVYQNEKYAKVQDKIDNYYMTTYNGQQSVEGYKRRIEIFINMLKVFSTEEMSRIIKPFSTEHFKTYKQDENGNFVVDKEFGIIGNFWNNNKDKILEIIRNNEEYNEISDKLGTYFLSGTHTSVDDSLQYTFGSSIEIRNKSRLLTFIDMLDMACDENELSLIIKNNSTEHFKTYKQDENGNFVVDKEFGIVGNFWQANKYKILPIIYQNEKYKKLQEKFDDYYMNSLGGQQTDEGQKRRIEIFINMLKVIPFDEMQTILKAGSIERFRTYKRDENGNYIIDKEYGSIGNYWSYNKEKISSVIYQDDKYIELREKLDNYYMMTPNGQQSIEGLSRRVDIFINMINISTNEKELLSYFNQRTDEKFKTYKQDENGNFVVDKEYGIIGGFWNNHKDKSIIPTLFYHSEYLDSKYDNARKNVMNYLNFLRRRRGLDEFKSIDEYIETLDKAKKEVKTLIELRATLLSKKDTLIKKNRDLEEQIESMSSRRAM